MVLTLFCSLFYLNLFSLFLRLLSFSISSLNFSRDKGDDYIVSWLKGEPVDLRSNHVRKGFVFAKSLEELERKENLMNNLTRFTKNLSEFSSEIIVQVNDFEIEINDELMNESNSFFVRQCQR